MKQPQTILVVDDLAANLQIVTAELEARGYAALVARSGPEAIERAALARPDLILLDVAMPEVDGFETCQRLKQDPATAEIPVIFMTAMAGTDEKIRGFRVGAVDYVTKPLNAEEVFARIGTHLSLDALRRELAAQKAALQRSNAELEQLAYVASHDLQEPLRMIASYLSLVERRYGERLDADGKEFIGYAVDGAKRLQAMINDLLAYSRVNTKAHTFVAVDCASIAATAVHQLRVAIEEHGAVVTLGDLPTVQGDPTQLLQLFQNLIGNAIKFHGQDPPRVQVGAESDESGWCFAVRDNGIGIAPEQFQRLFVLFQRLHGRQAYPGTGIGLALCKRIVELHGGRIWIESAPGEGATFKFTLPRAPAA